jgi:hypothetical protein
MEKKGDRNKKVLVLAETGDLDIHPTTFELLDMGR